MAGLLIPRILIAQAKDIEMVTRSLIRLLSLMFVVTNVVAAQSATPKKDISEIARTAKGAIVTIIMAKNEKPIARATGFLVKSDGTIVTTYHVIAKGNVAVVKFADGMVVPVDGVVATDKFHDLAVLKIHSKTFQTLTLGNSDQVQVGEEVVAIGNPLGLELTVSNGIVSGIRTDEKEEGKLLQITAPISHGSSGGPLFNMVGEVVGINAMSLEGGESLNFAIPVNDAKNLLQNQSAQLQQFPNELDRDTPEPDSAKPDASTGLPSDAAPPREKESGIAAPSHKTAKGNQPHSYYVRTYQHDSYIIEHDGRQLAATCRGTVTWPHGIDKRGSDLTEHVCTYVHISVGQQISPELMW
jgi:Trypsin-like peptidase domain